ncbi:inorganic phosphate transporter [Halococcus saccharolyticus]|uniref:Phosphate transporter n=1 Tax=Halococcus saccharolyticus DSM 5350 TaxID=1227455 RepID=M0MNK7_9EURY|nr:inorganic phosphate transporter [Halococcus saccharolyticus]EMA47287.1 phosphate permease [Halococcus saccharolyticus DSM 5350]
MVTAVLIIGLAVAVFVGFNIGGSSTGVAFGPAVGSRLVSKTGAAALFTGFALLGGATVGTEVIETMGGRIVPADQFTLAASVGVLFFVGLALLISNLFGVPASTSMTAVGAIAGLGVASGSLDYAVMFEIVSAWIVAPVLAFWICAVVGRYLYPYLDAWFGIDRSDGALFVLDRSGSVPIPHLAEDTSRKEGFWSAIVLAISCYMAFSAGASNTANAVAPLVGGGAISITQGVVLAAAAIGLGSFTIARRTLDTVGNDLTDLPLLASLVVAIVSATIITVLSEFGIPASLAVSATMCIVGLGWGRATRTTTVASAATAAIQGSEETTTISTNALAADDTATGTTAGDVAGDVTGDTANGDVAGAGGVPGIGEEEPDELAANDLFDPATTGRVVMLWIMTPSLSAAASFVLFELFPVYGGT